MQASAQTTGNTDENGHCMHGLIDRVAPCMASTWLCFPNTNALTAVLETECVAGSSNNRPTTNTPDVAFGIAITGAAIDGAVAKLLDLRLVREGLEVLHPNGRVRFDVADRPPRPGAL